MADGAAAVAVAHAGLAAVVEPWSAAAAGVLLGRARTLRLLTGAATCRAAQAAADVVPQLGEEARGAGRALAGPARGAASAQVRPGGTAGALQPLTSSPVLEPEGGRGRLAEGGGGEEEEKEEMEEEEHHGAGEEHLGERCESQK